MRERENTHQQDVKIKHYHFVRDKHVLYILTSVWVLGTPNAGQNSNFQPNKQKKAKKKKEILSKIYQKTRFLSLHQNAGRNIQQTGVHQE